MEPGWFEDGCAYGRHPFSKRYWSWDRFNAIPPSWGSRDPSAPGPQEEKEVGRRGAGRRRIGGFLPWDTHRFMALAR